jgi:predicted nucleic acid-binding protein
MEDVIELTDRTRLVITPDPVPLQVRDTDTCITGCYTTPSWWGNYQEQGPPPLHDFPGNLAEADDKLWDRTEEPDWAIRRWAWAFYGLELQRHGPTYWYCDANAFHSLHGGEFTREAQAEVIRSEREDYRRYIEGEAKIVTLQRLARFRRTTRKYHEHHQDLLEVWETIDSVADTYFDVRYTAADVAYESFYQHFTKKELTIVTAMIDEQRS